MDSNQFREAAHSAIEEIIKYYETLPSRPVVSLEAPGYLRPLLPSGPPTAGEPWSQIQADIERAIMPGLTHWQHPNFMAFFPANSSYPGILGEMYSAAFTAPAFNWLCSPAVTELETVMMDWLATLIGLPDCYLSKGEGGGVIQSTASEAIVVVMVAARERALKRLTASRSEGHEREEMKDSLRGKLIALGSDQAHSSTQKGAIIAGTKFRTIPTTREEDFSMRGQALRNVLEECRAEGLVPYYLTISLGTTNTCAVDAFEEIAEVMKDWPDVWVHVDAAYAGAALVCPEYQHLVKDVGSFDSFNFNMHKWLLTNFDASCLFVVKRTDLTTALSVTPSYLRNSYTDSGLVTDYRDWQIPLGRRFRSLKIWFVLRSYGIDGLQAHIRKHIKLGEFFHSLVLSRQDLFEVLTTPAFALTVITIKPPIDYHHDQEANLPPSEEKPNADSKHLEAANRITKEVYDLITKRGEFFLTSGVISGHFAIRIVSANANTEEGVLRRVFDVLVESSEEIMGNLGGAKDEKMV